MSKPWTLKRTRQCAKCPWRKKTNPHTIPNGYDVEKHRALSGTIAAPSSIEGIGEPLRVMACHETHNTHCIGWLVNQLGVGNNIPLRIHARDCTNLEKVRTIGPQHETFEDTLP